MGAKDFEVAIIGKMDCVTSVPQSSFHRAHESMPRVLMRSRADKPLKAKGNIEMYGMEGLDGQGNHFYKVPWVERQQEIAHRCAADAYRKQYGMGRKPHPADGTHPGLITADRQTRTLLYLAATSPTLSCIRKQDPSREAASHP